jgi:hypothetical protein
LPLPESVTGPYLALLGPASRGVTGHSFDAQEAVVVGSAVSAASSS